MRPHAGTDIQAECAVVRGAERQPPAGILEDRVEQGSTGTAFVHVRVDEQVGHQPDVAPGKVGRRADADDATLELGDAQALVAKDVLEVRVADPGQVWPADALVVRRHDPGEFG